MHFTNETCDACQAHLPCILCYIKEAENLHEAYYCPKCWLLIRDDESVESAESVPVMEEEAWSTSSEESE